MPNRTPDTPGVSESALGKMKIAELREHARKRGIDGAEDLRKPELLARVKDWHHAREHAGGAKKTSGTKNGGGARSAGRTGTGKNSARGNTTADTPGVSEAALSRMKVGELRAHARERGIDGADELRKPELLVAVKDWHYAQEHGGRRRPGAASNGGGKRARGRHAGGATDAKDGKGAKGAKDATKRESPKQDEDSVSDRLNLLEAAVRDLGKNLNALVRTLRSTIGM